MHSIPIRVYCHNRAYLAVEIRSRGTCYSLTWRYGLHHKGQSLTREAKYMRYASWGARFVRLIRRLRLSSTRRGVRPVRRLLRLSNALELGSVRRGVRPIRHPRLGCLCFLCLVGLGGDDGAPLLFGSGEVPRERASTTLCGRRNPRRRLARWGERR